MSSFGRTVFNRGDVALEWSNFRFQEFAALNSREGNFKSWARRSAFHACLKPRLSVFDADQEFDLFAALLADLFGFLQKEFLEFLAREPVDRLARIVQRLAKRTIEFINLTGFAFQVRASDGYQAG